MKEQNGKMALSNINRTNKENTLATALFTTNKLKNDNITKAQAQPRYFLARGFRLKF
ncbi:hypothetical protein PTUN_b0250 [Pseudoalteromonas tunicata]|jgi:hypothetical protein|uniref:Uncharacterized protein n=1 Tax=Pseudoalteromonas tunicata D2 TaxID=87626 RepID=A4C3B3_9GAMM|nr:hypothetical protein PTUN_b0250 [Pseudoalteromonas tunicata]EAR30045.1 hypothetical protein PTD2_00711 [Pseudoalteromonas tunicata D2]